MSRQHNAPGGFPQSFEQRGRRESLWGHSEVWGDKGQGSLEIHRLREQGSHWSFETETTKPVLTYPRLTPPLAVSAIININSSLIQIESKRNYILDSYSVPILEARVNVMNIVHDILFLTFNEFKKFTFSHFQRNELCVQPSATTGSY